jgi:hypothetical protein
MSEEKAHCPSCHKVYLATQRPDSCYDCAFPFTGTDKEKSKHIGQNLVKKNVINDASSAAKKASNLLFILAGIYIINVAIAEFATPTGLDIVDLIIYLWLVVCFIFCGAFLSKSPIIFSVIPLAALMIVYVLGYIANPSSIISGFILKIVSVVMLIYAISKNWEAEKLKKQNAFLNK